VEKTDNEAEIERHMVCVNDVACGRRHTDAN